MSGVRRNHKVANRKGLTSNMPEEIKEGARFGRLTVIVRDMVSPQKRRKPRWWWLCQCDCGGQVSVTTSDLRAGVTRSCGCLQKENRRRSDCKHRTHGMAGTPEHHTWLNLKYRCLNPEAPNSKYYIEKGVTVYAEWVDSFERFFKDVGPRPTSKHSIDRYPDPNGNYEPGNVRWATPKEQARNRRNNSLLTINEETRCVAEWNEIAGLGSHVVGQRLKRGLPLERLLEPVRKQ